MEREETEKNNHSGLLKAGERLDDLQYNGLYIIQNPDEYCFTSDAVALANFVHLSNYGRVVDLCSGSGIVGILVGAKNKVKDITFVEIQEHLADMSARTIAYNNLTNCKVVCDKLQGVHNVIGDGYDVVVCNPPYKESGTTKYLSIKQSIAIAKHEVCVELSQIIEEASKLLKFGGTFYICNKEERLTDIMMYCRQYKLEPKELKILPSKKGASVILLKAKKGGKSGMKILL